MVDLTEFKKFFLFNLIGSLIVSALIAVVTVLIGNFNQTMSRVLWTLAMVILHSLISLGFIWEDEKDGTFDKLSFFSNMLFLLIVLSFLTSIFGIWNIIDGDVVWRIYLTYGLLAVATLHGNVLYKATNKENYIDMIVYINYLFMAIVVLMLLPMIYVIKADFLGEPYYRILAAMGIIDGTLSILTVIFYKLFMHKHPKVVDPLEPGYVAGQKQARRKGLSIWVWILIIYLIAQVILPFAFFGFGRLF